MPLRISFLPKAAVFGARGAGVGLKAGAPGGAIEAGLESRASACTEGVAKNTTAPASATDEAPAMRQIPSGFFKVVLRVFLRITIRPFYQLDTDFPYMLARNIRANLLFRRGDQRGGIEPFRLTS
jgi:hypothetical protein